jgi:hypothetical protein
MKLIKSSILPSKQEFARLKEEHQLNLEAICVFVATGFFLGEDTYWKDQVCLTPGNNHIIDSDGFLEQSSPSFHWHYSPREVSFATVLDEYIHLLTDITKEQIGDSPVILPLSGGLDSRSQALILKDLKNPVHSFSYSFQQGYPEHHIAQKIAKVCSFDFEFFKIPSGYLWNCIDELAEINGCYSEFTNPRQMAVLPELRKMRGVISLGHWGDVLFDRGAPEGSQEKDILPLLFKKMVKPKGIKLAEQLWKAWDLHGDFTDYLKTRIESGLSKIDIDNVSARVRAFKTTHWAHRWTTTNLSIFANAHPITLPYYDDRMCKFICTVPEEFLADRRLQIAHLKNNKSLSNITWHAQKPFNINNYAYNKTPFNTPYRVLNKLQREKKSLLNKPFIQRNWELQFVGDDNDRQLKNRLFSKSFNEWIPKSIVETIYKEFRGLDPVHYAHPLSMLLTLSLWQQHFYTSQA